MQNWLQLFTSTVIAGLAVLIAYQQYRTNRYRARLDLFEKRFRVYWTIIETRNELLASRDIEISVLLRYMERTREGQFLFGKDAQKYLTQFLCWVLCALWYSYRRR